MGRPSPTPPPSPCPPLFPGILSLAAGVALLVVFDVTADGEIDKQRFLESAKKAEYEWPGVEMDGALGGIL